MSQRLSRREIKRDEVLETVGSAVDYARVHSRTIFVAIAAVIVAAIGVTLFVIWRQGREARANDALAEALLVWEAQIDPYDPAPEDPDRPKFESEAARATRARAALEAVRERFGGTPPAAVAGVYLGGLAARSGDADTARSLWEEFVDGQPDHLLSAQVRVNLMSLAREQGRSAELESEIRGLLEAAEPVLPEPVLLHQLALTLEALDRADEAREVYQRITSEHPTSPYRAAAQRRAELL